ncbi:MAG TPA: DUF559 domain-containing protein [Frankiaceae bacterium]|nr:DUF559 domain-containing protein [Frankiaceae bacterium]
MYRRPLAADEITCVGVLPLTTPDRTAIDVAAAAPTVEAVAAIDSALRLQQVSRTGLHSALLRRRTMPGYPAAATAVDLVDETSGSVPETIARLVFRSADLPVPVCQYEVTADGVWIARVEFAWPEARLVVEIDGFAWHSSKVAMQKDYERSRRLFHAGWDVLRFTADDLRTGPVAVAAEVRQALEARGFAGTHI